jgi:hypothetical protein
VVDFITDEFTKGLVIRLSLQATIVKIAPWIRKITIAL